MDLSFSEQLPDKDWICLAIANSQPDTNIFDKFVRTSVFKNILEFKGYGKFGEKLHDLFDDIISIMEIMENHLEIDVMTTWHENEELAYTFWQCFFATCLPEGTNLKNIKIVCIDLDGNNRAEELKSYLKEFESGRLPFD